MINVILYQPEIPTNTGNIIRTCLATGAKLHIIKPIAFDLHPRWFKRAAAGRFLSDIQHEIHESYEHFKNKYSYQKIHYITRYGLKTYCDVNFKDEKDIWVMFGTESTGIPKHIMQDSIDTCLRIPMTEHARSLNLANTVTLITYEIHRQKGFVDLCPFEMQKGKEFILEK